MKLREMEILYYSEGVLKTYKMNSLISKENNELTIESHVEDSNYGQIITINLKPKMEINIESFSMKYDMELENRKMFVNGFQTWTQSREMKKDDMLRDIHPIGRLFGLKPYGDYNFYNYINRKGILHSYTYTYLKDEKGKVIFLGSVNEKTGYTVFTADFNTNCLVISKDIEELRIKDEYEILKVYIGIDNEQRVFDVYFSLFSDSRNRLKQCTGWTSWYNYYTNVSEEIVIKNLEAMIRENIPLDVFQIDDGYQNAVGDWLIVNEKFPSGMKVIAERIKESGYRPGIWIAPFICEKKSQLFNEHKDWVMKDKHGNPVKAGWNPGWSGTFYALDFYNYDFRQYIKEVFHRIINIWGYEMIKLDFLYAVALIPRPDKTRGQIMSEVMDFLNDLIGDKWMLGCGVPLGPAFKKVDYCRIGSDVAPYWEDNKLKFLRYRERVSTLNSLYSTVGRYQLNNRAFYNDPDVFILRTNNNKMNKEQKYTLFLLNNLLGGLIFLSDYIEDYDEEEMELFKSMFPKIEPDIHRVTEKDGIYQMDFSVEDKEYTVFSNFNNKEAEISLVGGNYYGKESFIITKDSRVILKPYESKCYYRILSEEKIYIIGSTGHLFPGFEIKEFRVKDNSVDIVFKRNFINNTTVFIGIGEEIEELIVNGEKCVPKLINGYKVIEYTGGMGNNEKK